MEYSSKLTLTLALVFAMVAAVVIAQNSPAAYLIPHNTARAEVGLGPVTWDATVAAYAQNYAEQRRGDCQLVHSGGPYGENIYWSSSATASAANAVKWWVNEKQYYDHPNNSCAAGRVCGHYTQVVWSTSTAIGCARAVCNGNAGVLIICNYSPPGNFIGQSSIPSNIYVRTEHACTSMPAPISTTE